MYAIEYSKTQKCLNIDELERIVENNMKKFINNNDKNNDWIIIKIFKTMKEAERYCEQGLNDFVMEKYYGRKEKTI